MRINPPTLFLILVAAIVAVDQFSPLVAFTVPWPPWVAAALIIAGIGISVAGKRQFQRIGTNVYTFEEPGELVSEGLYRFSRNPMYLGLVLAGTGRELEVFALGIPSPVGANRDMHEIVERVHEVAGHLFVPLLALHVLGAIKHAVFDRRGAGLRMFKPIDGGR